MKVKTLIITLSVLSLLALSCTTTKIDKSVEKSNALGKQLLRQVNLTVEKNVSWINLMPGSEPKFNVSGKVILLKGNDYNLETTHLVFVKVYQNGKEIYFIKPKVREEKKKDFKTFLFSTIQGLTIVKELDAKKKVDFEYVFKDGKNEYKYQVKDVELQEVQ